MVDYYYILQWWRLPSAEGRLVAWAVMAVPRGFPALRMFLPKRTRVIPSAHAPTTHAWQMQSP